MAEDVVIRAEGLGKKYLIGHTAERAPYLSLRDVLTHNARNIWRRTADITRGRAMVAGDTVEEFWALKRVSFEVKRGEVLGSSAATAPANRLCSRSYHVSPSRPKVASRSAAAWRASSKSAPAFTPSSRGAKTFTSTVRFSA